MLRENYREYLDEISGQPGDTCAADYYLDQHPILRLEMEGVTGNSAGHCWERVEKAVDYKYPLHINSARYKLWRFCDNNVLVTEFLALLHDPMNADKAVVDYYVNWVEKAGFEKTLTRLRESAQIMRDCEGKPDPWVEFNVPVKTLLGRVSPINEVSSDLHSMLSSRFHLREWTMPVEGQVDGPHEPPFSRQRLIVDPFDYQQAPWFRKQPEQFKKLYFLVKKASEFQHSLLKDTLLSLKGNMPSRNLTVLWDTWRMRKSELYPRLLDVPGEYALKIIARVKKLTRGQFEGTQGRSVGQVLYQMSNGQIPLPQGVTMTDSDWTHVWAAYHARKEHIYGKPVEVLREEERKGRERQKELAQIRKFLADKK